MAILNNSFIFFLLGINSFLLHLLHICYISCYKPYAIMFFLLSQPFFSFFMRHAQYKSKKVPIYGHFCKHFIQFYRLWRATSNIKMDAAMAAFKDSTCPCIGI